MNVTILEQIQLWILFLISGILIGIFFDLFRVLRKTFKTSDIITYIEDIIFGILTGIFLLFLIFYLNHGEIRLYLLIAIILGCVIYYLTISKYFIKWNVFLLNKICYVIEKIIHVILFPFLVLFKILNRLFLHPIKILLLKLQKKMKKFVQNRKNIFIFTKKEGKSKKDIA